MRPIRSVALVAVAGTLWATQASSQVLRGPIPREAPGQALANVSFEVESVKENPLSRQEAGPPHLSLSASGLFVAARETVWQLVMLAYDVRAYQIVAGPEWMATTLFDVVAKAPENFESGQTRAMLRHLLADRFGLLVQKEMRAMPTYSLEWVDRRHKLGPGIRPSLAQCGDSSERAGNAPPADRAGSSGGSSSGARGAAVAPAGQSECRSMAGWGDGIFVRRASLASLVALLNSSTGRPVIDKTGLTGIYDVDVKHVDVQSRGLVPGSFFGPNVGEGLGERGSIFTAVREQLNLKLVPANDKVEVLVIGRLERPTPN
ncbi:MAG TPA: TIGR03435 family protein [Chloroflexota bacterium]|nr:TIGR03435 family protein [Chloroflexota bacterium]